MDESTLLLAQRTLPRCRSIQEPYLENLPLVLDYHRLELGGAIIHDAFRGIPIIDIGAGNDWKENAREFLGETDEWPIPLRASYVTAVDPFFPEETHERMRMVQQDGLTFLMGQPDNSANVILSGLDKFIIPSDRYLQLLVQEAYRIVPPGGICIGNTPEIKQAAKRLFREELWGGLYLK